jgi:uncharacterized protein (TIGR02452 family)
MNRNERAAVAAQTDQIISQGWYVAPSGARVEIAAAVTAAVAGTRMYQPEELSRAVPAGEGSRAITVTGESTLAAAARLMRAGDGAVACLNFASAKHPGGGYRSGAQAQEESLARSSALVAALSAVPEFYAFHQRQRDPRYSHRVVHSPAVPVFRDDSGRLLERPYQVGFLTAAAPNAGAITDATHLAEVPRLLRERAARVVAVAHQHGYRRLVLGAWGCGVFRNDPAVVAQAFAVVLAGAAPFEQVVFAVLDNSAGATQLAAFRAAFEG